MDLFRTGRDSRDSLKKIVFKVFKQAINKMKLIYVVGHNVTGYIMIFTALCALSCSLGRSAVLLLDVDSLMS